MERDAWTIAYFIPIAQDFIANGQRFQERVGCQLTIGAQRLAPDFKNQDFKG